MDQIQTKIINHFKENHKRLLQGSAVPAGNIHPNDITPVGEVRLAPSGSDDLEFTAKFKIGTTTVSYFGTINYSLKIVDEAVSGRNSDGTIKS